jgi:predicted amidophosphoribosyltransferase
MVVAILTGHAPVRKHVCTMGLFEGDPTCRFCREEAETVRHIICCCEALARQHYNVFGSLAVEPTPRQRYNVFGSLAVEPADILQPQLGTSASS